MEASCQSIQMTPQTSKPSCLLLTTAHCSKRQQHRRAMRGLAWASLAMEVVSEEMALAMPKSISLSCPSTTRKLAGFRSLCTILAS